MHCRGPGYSSTSVDSRLGSPGRNTSPFVAVMLPVPRLRISQCQVSWRFFKVPRAAHGPCRKESCCCRPDTSMALSKKARTCLGVTANARQPCAGMLCHGLWRPDHAGPRTGFGSDGSSGSELFGYMVHQFLGVPGELRFQVNAAFVRKDDNRPQAVG